MVLVSVDLLHFAEIEAAHFHLLLIVDLEWRWVLFGKDEVLEGDRDDVLCLEPLVRDHFHKVLGR